MDILSEILGLPTDLQLIEESIDLNSLSIDLMIASTRNFWNSHTWQRLGVSPF
jgi:hypothetical protein